MRTRTLRPSFWKSEDIAPLPFEARLLYQGLWSLADVCGRLEDRPLRIKAEIFPFDAVDVAALLERLVAAGLVVRYEAAGRKLLWIPTFWQHQYFSTGEWVAGSSLPRHPDDPWDRRPPKKRNGANQEPAEGEPGADSGSTPGGPRSDPGQTQGGSGADQGQTKVGPEVTLVTRNLLPESEPPPLPPAAAGGRESERPAPGGRAQRTGRRRRNQASAPPPMPTELTPAAARVVAAIQEALGAPEPYPPEACAALEARLRGEPMALTEDQALTVVRWAAGDEYWGGKVQLAPNKLFAPDRAGELLTRAIAVERRRPAPAPEPPKDWEAEEERWAARRWWEQLPRDERERVEDEATKRAVQRFGSVHQSCIDRVLVEMRREREAAERRPLEATG